MSGELLKGKPTEGYLDRVEGVKKIRPRIPQVKIFSMAEPDGRTAFAQALRPFSKTLPAGAELINEAVSSGIFIDEYREYLKDLYKLDSPQDKTLEEYITDKDVWENSVVVERSWIEGKRRFVRIPKEEDFERIARSRNAIILSDETQQKLREQIFAIGGMGVGSAVGYLLVLTGAKNFRVADGGNLEPHNLNRFIGGDIGKVGQNLAVVWAQMAYEANPFINIECKPKKLSRDGEDGTIKIEDFVKDATMGIEEVDDLQVKKDFREVAKALGVPVLMVTDLARKGGRVAFAGKGKDHILKRLTPQALRLLQDSQTDRKVKTNIAIDVFIGRRSPKEHLEPLRRSATELSFWPQSGASAFISAAGGVNTIVDYLEGIEVPEERTLNLWKTKGNYITRKIKEHRGRKPNKNQFEMAA